MTRKKSVGLAVAGTLVLAVAVIPAMSTEVDPYWTGPYNVDPNWPQNPCGEGYQIGSSAGIFAETPNRVFVFARGCLPVLEDAGGVGGPTDIVPDRNASGYDLSRDDAERHPKWSHVLYILNREGALIDNWDQHNDMFVRPHRVKINPYDPERHVWVVDDSAQQVTKFTHDGSEVVMQLGQFREPGNDETHFGRPTDIAWLPDGTFFISDGYTNTRVVKFDKDGNYITSWGEPSERGVEERRPNYFRTVHGIAIDDNRRLYVIDRTNNRIQIFDENGKFLEQWTDIKRPYYIYMSAEQHLWIADATTQKFLKFDLNGNLLFQWGSFGAFPGGNWGVHQFAADSDGNFYTADVHIGRIQKYVPKPGANRDELVGEWRPLSGSLTD